MNKQPVSYLQYDARWKNNSYAVSGETSTIGSAGCGPTSAAMLISTITGKTVTPADTCKWSLAHGYKALNQGTYYSYFAPQFAAYGITCKQLNTTRLMNDPTNKLHENVINLLKEGYYIIALMGPGNWTKAGHFIVVWWVDDKFYINDPASTAQARLLGDAYTFRKECRMYWAVDARIYNKEDDDLMTAIEQIAAAAGVSTAVVINRLALTVKFQDDTLNDYQKQGVQKLKDLGFISVDRDGRAQVNWGDLGTVVDRLYEKTK